jgi:hypothetical protein
MRTLLLFATLLTAILPGADIGRAQSDTPDTKFWVPNEEVYAIAVTDSTIYLGGIFS